MYMLFASRSKAKAKTRRRTPACSLTRTVPIGWKNLDWYWARRLFAHRLPSVKTTEFSSSSWSSTSRRRWSDWILEIKGLSSGRSCAISSLVWWKWEEHNGKRRRKQEKIAILYWSIRTKFIVSELFKVVQDAISLILHYRTMYSERHLRVHLSHRMCNQFTLHEFRIDTRRTIWAKDWRYSSRLWIQWTRNTEIRKWLTWNHRVLHSTSRKCGRNQKNAVYWVDIKLVQKKRYKFYQTRSKAIIFSEGYYDGNWRNHLRECICVTSTSS